MLKTIGLSRSAPRTFGAEDEIVGGVGGGKTDETIKNLPQFKKLKNNKSKNLMHIEATGEPLFLTPNAKEAFNLLRQVFIKASILQHFNPECHI